MFRTSLAPDFARALEGHLMLSGVRDAADLARFIAALEIAAAFHVTEERAAQARFELAHARAVPAHLARRDLLRALREESQLEEPALLFGQRFEKRGDQPVDLEVFDALVTRRARVVAEQ